MSTWLVIGSSPLAIQAMERAKADQRVDKTITTNRGIYLDPQPSYYFLSDALACKLFADNARQAHAAGTLCVTLRRNDHALKKRGVEWFDIIEDEKPPREPFALSGLWCLEFAAAHGAKTILLVGMDGWSSDPAVMDYFDPAEGKTTHVTHWSRDIIQPRCSLLAAKYPDVAWIQYGRPEFQIGESNWMVEML